MRDRNLKIGGKSGFRDYSVIDGAVISEYFAGGAPCDFEIRFDSAVKTFEKESSQALCLHACNGGNDGLYRYELIRPFIIKLLLYLGILPKSNKPMLAARLIENLALHGSSDVNAVISAEAERTGIKAETVVRALDKDLNPYDRDLTEKLFLLTGTRPQTTKDMLCDLSVYVGGRYIGGNGNERYIR